MTNESYYYTSLESKLKEILTSTKIPLSSECESRTKVVEDMSYAEPVSKFRIYASSHPIEMKSFGKDAGNQAQFGVAHVCQDRTLDADRSGPRGA